MKELKHWQDPMNALLGIWVLLSPWALGFQDMTMAMSNAVIIGLALIAAALGAIFVPRAWEEWTEGALGLWLIASPFIFGYADTGDLRYWQFIFGAVVVLLAVLELWQDWKLSDKELAEHGQ